MFTIKHTFNKARSGTLKTRHGLVPTPFYMPCATIASGKSITSDDYNNLGVDAVISNSFLLSLKPGIEVIKKFESIHHFMDFKKTVFTDCGGFQSGRDSLFMGATKKGLHFRSPYDNHKLRITPKSIIDIQMAIGSDVAMSLDHMPPYGAKHEYVVDALKRTHEWAKECLSYHTDKKQLLFGICQGGFDFDLRVKSAQYIANLDFDGIAVGGLAIGEPRLLMLKAMEASTSVIPQDKIRYAMGIGSPIDILESVSRGIDCFDSVFPTQNARHGTLFTFNGKLDLGHRKNMFEHTPIEIGCQCHTCKRYSRAYLYHLLKMKEYSVLRLLSIHNIHFMMQFMKKIRMSIEKGEFDDFKKQMIAVYSKKSV